MSAFRTLMFEHASSMLGIVLMISSAPEALADTGGGCVNSPESATAALALLGGGAAVLGRWRRRRRHTHRPG